MLLGKKSIRTTFLRNVISQRTLKHLKFIRLKKLHCSFENNTENQNKYFILISINLYENVFPFLLHICLVSIFQKNTERLSYTSIWSFASKVFSFFAFFFKIKIKSYIQWVTLIFEQSCWRDKIPKLTKNILFHFRYLWNLSR
jgi:hypothetical protein